MKNKLLLILSLFVGALAFAFADEKPSDIPQVPPPLHLTEITSDSLNAIPFENSHKLFVISKASTWFAAIPKSISHIESFKLAPRYGGKADHRNPIKELISTKISSQIPRPLLC